MTPDGQRPVEPSFDLSIRGCLDFLLPALPDALIDSDARLALQDAVRHLPPTGGLGLELRLGGDRNGVDIHQVFRAAGADPTILRRYLAGRVQGPLEDPVVRRFLGDWASDVDDMQDAFHSLYVEWDRPTSGNALPPAVFVPLDPSGAREEARRVQREMAIRCCQRLDPVLGRTARGAIERVGEQIPAGSSVNYLGLMLSRGGAMRVNVRGVRPDDLGALLLALHWRGDVSTATRHFESLVALSDRVIIGLDFATDLGPAIGFEAILDLPPGRDPRWSGLFDYFAVHGGCSREEREALQAVPADLYPETKDQPWPAAWLVAALVSPRAFTPWVERRLSHLKLVIAADGAVSSKAYLSAQHHWRRSAEPHAFRSASSASDEIIAQAAEQAVGFISAAIGQDDLWRDFSMPGASDEWVTGFVGWALAPHADDRARLAAGRSLEALLRRQRADGGWGYNAQCASDADSTAWVLKFLDAMQVAGPAVDKARSLLRSHILPGGGLSTYSATAQLRFDDAPWDGPGDGWRGSHLCVAANAASVLPGALGDTLAAGQASEGSWPAYWWRSDVFSTALAVEALSKMGVHEEERARAVAWARGQEIVAASAFDRAWLAQILLHGEAADVEAAQAILFGLSRLQLADGSWAPGAQLCLPHPSQTSRDDRLVPFLDVRRLYTTASVLAALTRFGEGLAR